MNRQHRHAPGVFMQVQPVLALEGRFAIIMEARRPQSAGLARNVKAAGAVIRVAIGIGSGRSAAADRAVARAGVLRAAEDIAAVVVGVVPLADEGQRFAVRGCDALVPICHIAFLTCIYIDKCVGLHFTVSAATHEFHW